MILLLFDIDGTLTDTSEDDGRLFLQALRETAGVTEAPADWESFTEVTAPAIARELIARKEGRRAREGEVYRVREADASGWKEALETGRVAVRPMPGAAALLAEARARPGFYTAIVTGAWGPPALAKLQASGLPVDGMVLVSADDAETRKGILNTAAILAAAERGIPGFSAVVAVGDGVWDARAARAAGAAFVGVTADPAKALRMSAEGAGAVVADLADPARFWAAVETALSRLRVTGRN